MRFFVVYAVCNAVLWKVHPASLKFLAVSLRRLVYWCYQPVSVYGKHTCAVGTYCASTQPCVHTDLFYERTSTAWTERATTTILAQYLCCWRAVCVLVVYADTTPVRLLFFFRMALRMSTPGSAAPNKKTSGSPTHVR